jgi:hypothetical protein
MLVHATGRIVGAPGGYISHVSPDMELMVIFGALHAVALALGGLLFYMFLRSDTTSTWRPPDEDEGGGGGGNDRRPTHRPKPRPTGGVPLPDAEPSSHRLREPGTLRERYAKPARRPAHPATPAPSRRPLRRV